MNSTVLKEVVQNNQKVNLFNTSELNLALNVAIAKMAEYHFKEPTIRYLKDLIETNQEMEEYTLKSLAATPVKRH